MPIPPGSCITFDMGYVDYEAWQKFTDDDITYVTREKKKCRRITKRKDNKEEGTISLLMLILVSKEPVCCQ